MRPSNRIRTLYTLTTMAWAGLILHAVAADISLQLPRPDGKPGEATKPVKVYILAGESNMVGMWDISGARPPYPSVFLSADPAIVPAIGGSAPEAHAGAHLSVWLEEQQTLPVQ